MKGICLTNCCTVCNLYGECPYRMESAGGKSLCCSKCPRFFSCEVYLRLKGSYVIRLFHRWRTERCIPKF